MAEMPPNSLIADLRRAGINGPVLAAGDLGSLRGRKGAYLLLLGLDAPVRVDIPTLLAIRCSIGWYLYAGSASGPGGIGARLARHFRMSKKMHWYVDRLMEAAAERNALAFPAEAECSLVAKLDRSEKFEIPIRGFGSSDCRICESHLLRWTGDESGVRS